MRPANSAAGQVAPYSPGPQGSPSPAQRRAQRPPRPPPLLFPTARRRETPRRTPPPTAWRCATVKPVPPAARGAARRPLTGRGDEHTGGGDTHGCPGGGAGADRRPVIENCSFTCYSTHMPSPSSVLLQPLHRSPAVLFYTCGRHRGPRHPPLRFIVFRGVRSRLMRHEPAVRCRRKILGATTGPPGRQRKRQRSLDLCPGPSLIQGDPAGRSRPLSPQPGPAEPAARQPTTCGRRAVCV